MINEKLRDQALRYALEDSDESEGTEIRGLEQEGSQGNSDKALLRIYVAFQVLAQLGFTEERIDQCILAGLKEGDGWTEAVEWVSDPVQRRLLMCRCGFT